MILIIFIFYPRAQDEDNENPCFPTRNDRMAFITDGLVRERCVNFIQNFKFFIYFYFFYVQQILTDYLNKVLKHPKFRAHPATVRIKNTNIFLTFFILA